ncbi:toll/interleukin-1 receptor domain-containing protein [Dyadobacter sp. NIV53]|uniref:toll/interleukin-1 receptor domain-containing protein n=1 Tax=Dyadobacter sp. NIV53 TaxID=2861765 RepID=UPI001C866DB1|nr:toll/interleukin-1 receptor domain-containing protein [Dyadobacter sp. NIV53]
MPEKSLRVFLSYAHEDEAMKNDLRKFLINLIRSKQIEVWQDRELLAGSEWDDSIKNELAIADIILLLISVDFNASEYIWEKELATAMERHDKGEARVIPIILRKCEWGDMPYAKLQALPTNAKPVTEFADRDEAYTDIAKGIRKVVEYLAGK